MVNVQPPDAELPAVIEIDGWRLKPDTDVQAFLSSLNDPCPADCTCMACEWEPEPDVPAGWPFF